ncbi:MAG: M48 family metallopeptidase [Gallionella sp.]|nr:M48 family metallopeptidase [Gallionella sp.]
MFKRQNKSAVPPAVEERAALLAGKNISYILKRSSRRRSIGLRIDDHGLTVSIPLRASEKWLYSVLQDKASWVVEKLDGWQPKRRTVIPWMDGERIPFRGEEFILYLLPKTRGATPQLLGDTLHVPVGEDADAARIEKAVTHWYKSEAMRVFTECVDHFAPLIKVAPREIKLTSARTQWGSCTIQGVVRLNWQLVKMKLHLIDYVVVHELAHLVEMNHSPAFWRVVESVCPEYKQCRTELRIYGVTE